jgi:thiosulfate reductase cytochrome b subunit
LSTELGRILILLGILFVLVGLAIVFKIQIPWLGKLPGDIYIKKENVQIYFPLATCLLLSLILTAILYFFRK